VALAVLALVGLRKLSQSGPSDRSNPAAQKVAVAGLAAPSASAETSVPPEAQGAGLSSPGLDLLAPFRNYPKADTFQVEGHRLVAEYAADSLVQARIGVYLERYLPDAAVVMACDLRTGRVLGVGERADSAISLAPRLAFRAGFPAASLVKILTATAALENRGSRSRPRRNAPRSPSRRPSANR
jgi:hypothetical protein